MKSSLSRRLYNSSLTLAISFSFYALIFAFTLSCETEEGHAIPIKSPADEVTHQEPIADTTAFLAEEAAPFGEEIAN